jgi:zinc transporter 7
MVATNAIVAALCSTFLISLAPNAFLLAFPDYASGEGEGSQYLSLGQALAAGGLLGDVFLHTIPHAGDSHDTGLWIMLGFTIFLTADVMLRSLGGHQHHSHNGGSRDDDDDKKSHGHHDDHKTATISLNLAADALHNFTDGLAIGASFSMAGNHNEHASILSLMQSRGGLATLSILFHEIPHELGDFAILVKNGFSKNQAILAQFGTAVAALVGTLVGLMLEGFAGESLIFITAGGFVYLAAVSILPEILEESGTSFRFRLAQLACFGIGIAFMHAVSLLESMDGDHGHGHSHGHHHHDVEHKEHHDEHHDDGHNDHHEHNSHDHHHDHEL